MSKLYGYSVAGVRLADALALFSDVELTGYVQTPAHFLFCKWNNSTLEFGIAGEPEQIYEAKLFCEAGEFRWVRNPQFGLAGNAAWVSETEKSLSGWEPQTPLDVLPIDGDRLMTGNVTSAHDRLAGWSWMDAPRHGKVALPASGIGRPVFRVREYLGNAPGSAGEDGNRMVIEERITAIGFIGIDK